METLIKLRNIALETYILENGLISTSGKFEGEPIYTPVLWELAGDGFADADTHDGNTKLFFFNVDDDLRTVFPEIPKDAKSLILWETDNGFVYSGESEKHDADEWCDRHCKCGQSFYKGE